MIVRKILPYIIALAFAAGSVWLYYEITRDTLPPPSSLAVVPHEANELWVVRDPATVTARLKNQPAYFSIHPTFQLLFELNLPTGDQDELSWLAQSVFVSYVLDGDDEVSAVFGLPAGWSSQQQESWCVKFLNARPLRSGMLTIEGEGRQLFLRVRDNRCFVTISDREPSTNNKPNELSKVADAARMGSKSAVVQVLTGSRAKGVVPFLADLESDVIVRDVYFSNQHLRGEEIVILDDQVANLSALPARWQRLIPEGVTAFEAVGMESGFELIDRKLKQLEEQGQLAAWNGKLAELENELAADTESDIASWWNGGIGRFQAFGFDYVLLGSADSQVARRGLSSVGSPMVEAFLEGSIIEWEQVPLFEHLLGASLSEHMKVAWVNRNEVIFAQDRNAILKLAARVASGAVIDDGHLISRALFRKERFVQYREQESAFDALSGIVLPAYTPDEDRNTTHLIFSGTHSQQELLVTRFELSPAATTQVPATFVWENNLPGLRPLTIAAIRNHNNGEFYTVLQDTLNQLHAFDARGRRMWTYKADAEMIGAPETVDLLKNGKFQVMFATAKGVHCVDLLGRSVSGFPIRPKGASITTPLYIADYESNRNYRFLFGTSNGMVNNYKADGKPTQGWNYKAGRESAKFVTHLKAGNADYIFVAYEGGQVQLLKRNGEPRHSTKLRLPEFQGDPVFRMTSDIVSSTVVVCDTSGIVLEGSFGNGNAPELKKVSEAEVVILADLNRDRLQDMVVISGSRVAAFDASGKLMYKRDFGQDLLLDLRVYQFAAGTRVGVIGRTTGELHLLESDGTTADGFPLFAGGPCVIRDFTGDGRLEVVTTDGQGLVLCYRL